MPWIKKNLTLVIGGVVTLALLGWAGYFLYSQIAKEGEVTRELEDQTTKLDGLKNRKPHPGDKRVDNIQAAGEQEKDLQGFIEEAMGAFVPLAYPTNLDGQQFPLLLANTLDELRRDAKANSVKIPEDYTFGFSAQSTLMTFEQSTIEPMTKALIEIRAISEILFDARVNTLDRIRRVAIASQDTPGMTPGASDYWTKETVTNDLAVIVPYEFTVHCFTPELGRMLQGLYSSPHGFIVKNLKVDKVASTLLAEKKTEDSYDYGPMGGGRGDMRGSRGMDRSMMARYGLGGGGRYGMPPREEELPPEDDDPQLSSRNVLDERPLRAVLRVEVVRLKDPDAEEATGAASSAARSPNLADRYGLGR